VGFQSPTPAPDPKICYPYSHLVSIGRPTHLPHWPTKRDYMLSSTHSQLGRLGASDMHNMPSYSYSAQTSHATQVTSVSALIFKVQFNTFLVVGNLIEQYLYFPNYSLLRFIFLVALLLSRWRFS